MTENIDPAALAVRTDGAVDFVRQHEHRKDLVRRGFALLSEASFTAPKDERFNDPERALKSIERDAWLTVAERFELRRVMSVEAHRDFSKQMREDELPPITVDNVLAFVAGIRAQIGDFHEAAVKEVWEWLRPREHDRVHGLKTNTELEVGKRVVLSGMISTGCRDELQVRYGSGHLTDPSMRLLALERVLLALDGRGMTGAGNWSEIQNAIDGRRVGPDGSVERTRGEAVGETEFFKYRACKNGNLHLEFRRPDLIAKLNSVAAGNVLRPAHGVTKSQRRRARRPDVDARDGGARSEKELAYFATPPALARRMVALAGIRPLDIVLEPSAGEGVLVAAVLEACPSVGVDCFEIDPDRAYALRRIGCSPREEDFLAAEPHGELFDSVIANPPWHNRSDTFHVAAMLRWLRPGGSLVALMSGSAMTRTDAATVELRADVAALGGTIEMLDGEPFAPATSARCCLVHVPRTT